MRISDWSSDVCSSDLQFLQRVVVQRCLADRMAETQVVGDRARDRTPVAPAHRHVVAQVPAGQRPKQVAGAVDHPQPGEEDRKSVVEGKSVSVRVNLGGRRFIKKKKKKILTLNN